MKFTHEEIKKYKNASVIRRFQKEYPAKKEDAEQIFEDLLSFFWCSKKLQEERKLSEARGEVKDGLSFHFIMDEEMKDMDLMWHVFLLYTQDYAEFCEKYFGEFLHHLPDLIPDQRVQTFDYLEQLERFLVFSIMHLGEETVRRWFSDSLLLAEEGVHV